MIIISAICADVRFWCKISDKLSLIQNRLVDIIYKPVIYCPVCDERTDFRTPR